MKEGEDKDALPAHKGHGLGWGRKAASLESGQKGYRAGVRRVMRGGAGAEFRGCSSRGWEVKSDQGFPGDEVLKCCSQQTLEGAGGVSRARTGLRKGQVRALNTQQVFQGLNMEPDGERRPR